VVVVEMDGDDPLAQLCKKGSTILRQSEDENLTDNKTKEG
jgi:hypothetical protein